LFGLDKRNCHSPSFEEQFANGDTTKWDTPSDEVFGQHPLIAQAKEKRATR
jgi:hypothetical protein